MGRLQTRQLVERERGRTNQRRRERYFRQHPLCVRCEQAGRIRAATQLDHVVALVNGGTNDDSNRQGLCDDCHKAKTAEDLGHQPKRRFGPDGWPIDE